MAGGSEKGTSVTEVKGKLHGSFVLKMPAKAGVKPPAACAGNVPPQSMPIALDSSFQEALAKGNYLDTLGLRVLRSIVIPTGFKA